jgi:ERCC4-type nuclease
LSLVPFSPAASSAAAELLVAPTEPLPLRRLGALSTEPERHGCDVLWRDGVAGLVGIQRKTLTDLWASLRDGRLARELLAMSASLTVAVLLLEGRQRWGPGGRLSTAAVPFDRDQLRGLLLSVQQRGVWVVPTDDLDDSARAIVHLRSWVAKRRHTSLDLRPSGRSGPPARGWGVQLLQAFPHVGPGVAGAVWDHFGGVPLAWTVDARELSEVALVGPVRAASMLASLPPLGVDEVAS